MAVSALHILQNRPISCAAIASHDWGSVRARINLCHHVWATPVSNVEAYATFFLSVPPTNLKKFETCPTQISGSSWVRPANVGGSLGFIATSNNPGDRSAECRVDLVSEVDARLWDVARLSELSVRVREREVRRDLCDPDEDSALISSACWNCGGDTYCTGGAERREVVA